MSSDYKPYDSPGGGIHRGAVAAAAALILLALGGGYYWWQQSQAAPAPTPVAQASVAEPTPVPVASPPPASAAPPPAPATASAPDIQHPIDAASAAAPPTPEHPEKKMVQALNALLASKPGAAMVIRDDFVRRAVVTIDNLGRAHAAPRLWPIEPSAGKFSVQRLGEQDVVAIANSARYNTVVTLAASVDPVRAAALYKQHYPLFQATYQELGYPQAYFNDRLVAVIDQLLATPEAPEPLAVTLVEIKGEVPSTQPWTRYEFVDPKLEALPAGSKMLLRMGSENARRMKAKLTAFRSAIAKP
jgi:hypothetical protein